MAHSQIDLQRFAYLATDVEKAVEAAEIFVFGGGAVDTGHVALARAIGAFEETSRDDRDQAWMAASDVQQRLRRALVIYDEAEKEVARAAGSAEAQLLEMSR